MPEFSGMLGATQKLRKCPWLATSKYSLINQRVTQKETQCSLVKTWRHRGWVIETTWLVIEHHVILVKHMIKINSPSRTCEQNNMLKDTFATVLHVRVIPHIMITIFCIIQSTCYIIRIKDNFYSFQNKLCPVKMAHCVHCSLNLLDEVLSLTILYQHKINFDICLSSPSSFLLEYRLLRVLQY